MKRFSLIPSLCFFAIVTLHATSVYAQEPAFMEAGTHPGANQLYNRLLISNSKYQEAGSDIKDNSALLKIAYGIRPDFAVLVDSEFAILSTDTDRETGARMTALQMKYRLLRMDLGPLNTWRTSLIGGIVMPGSIDTANVDGSFPRCSIASTAILGRHGLNAGIEWHGYRHEQDRYSINVSHLFRLHPAEYALNTAGAWYTMLELLNDFNRNGDYRSDAAFGILYEARRWALELSLRLPLAEDWQPESDYTLRAGFRFLP